MGVQFFVWIAAIRCFLRSSCRSTALGAMPAARAASALSPSLARSAGRKSTHSIEKGSERKGISKPVHCRGNARVGVDRLHDGSNDSAVAVATALPSRPLVVDSTPQGGAGTVGECAADAVRGDGTGDHLLERVERLVGSGPSNDTTVSDTPITTVGVVVVDDLRKKVRNGTKAAIVGTPLVDRDPGGARPVGTNGNPAAVGSADGAPVVVPRKHALVARPTDGVTLPAAIEGTNYGVYATLGHLIETNWALAHPIG